MSTRRSIYRSYIDGRSIRSGKQTRARHRERKRMWGSTFRAKGTGRKETKKKKNEHRRQSHVRVTEGATEARKNLNSASDRFSLSRARSGRAVLRRRQHHARRTRTYVCVRACVRPRTYCTRRMTDRDDRTCTVRKYSPQKYFAANTARPSHRPYLHPHRSVAESAAIFYTREHILHCDVGAPRRSAGRRLSHFGRFRRRMGSHSCIFGPRERDREIGNAE